MDVENPVSERVKIKSKRRKILFIVLGLLCLVLAYFGILMPGFPAIPFILTALFFFAESSDRLLNWMTRQKIIRKILSKTDGKKANFWFKVFVISQLWVSITVAELLFIRSLWAGIALAAVGIAFSIITWRLMSK